MICKKQEIKQLLFVFMNMSCGQDSGTSASYVFYTQQIEMILLTHDELSDAIWKYKLSLTKGFLL